MHKLVTRAMLPALLASGQMLWAGTVSGSSQGTFQNPVGAPGMVTTGVGTSTFTWGDPTGFPTGPSSLHFGGLAFNSVPTETQFKIGALDYFNGTVNAGTFADTVSLVLAVDFSDPNGITQNFAYDLQLINTPNTGTPDEAADYVILPPFPDTILQIGAQQYTLKLAFGNVTANGFVIVNQFHVLEGQSASADLIGTITSDVSGVVPEPGTLVLVSPLLFATALRLRRRQVR